MCKTIWKLYKILCCLSCYPNMLCYVTFAMQRLSTVPFLCDFWEKLTDVEATGQHFFGWGAILDYNFTSFTLFPIRLTDKVFSFPSIRVKRLFQRKPTTELVTICLKMIYSQPIAFEIELTWLFFPGMEHILWKKQNKAQALLSQWSPENMKT